MKSKQVLDESRENLLSISHAIEKKNAINLAVLGFEKLNTLAELSWIIEVLNHLCVTVMMSRIPTQAKIQTKRKFRDKA